MVLQKTDWLYPNIKRTCISRTSIIEVFVVVAITLLIEFHPERPGNVVPDQKIVSLKKTSYYVFTQIYSYS